MRIFYITRLLVRTKPDLLIKDCKLPKLPDIQQSLLAYPLPRLLNLGLILKLVYLRLKLKFVFRLLF